VNSTFRFVIAKLIVKYRERRRTAHIAAWRAAPAVPQLWWVFAAYQRMQRRAPPGPEDGSPDPDAAPDIDTRRIMQ
jgi:hypothetical protein